MIEAYASGVTYSRAKFRYTTAMWCARRHRPFTIVEDPEFEVLCRMLYNKVEIPSRTTVSRDVHTILAYTKVRVIKLFMVCSSRALLCLRRNLTQYFMAHRIIRGG